MNEWMKPLHPWLVFDTYYEPLDDAEQSTAHRAFP